MSDQLQGSWPRPFDLRNVLVDDTVDHDSPVDLSVYS